MHNYYKLYGQAITNIMKRHIKTIEKHKQIKLSTTLNLKHQTLSLRITPILLKYPQIKPM